MRRKRISTEELFAKAAVGVGVTEHYGSDSYGRWICYVDPKTKTIGMYTPHSWFKNDWTDGSMEHDPFDPKHGAEAFYQAWRGHWYRLDALGRRTGRVSFSIGACSFYQNPSF